jgi:cystine transport system substrate-binding protein
VAKGGWLLGLAVRADDEQLAQALQAALSRLMEQGQIEKIFREHNVSWVRP